MTDDYAELKRLAEAATPGPWVPTRKKEICTTIRSDDQSHGMHLALADAYLHEDVAFIAAANPATILSLIAEVEEAKADRELFATPIAILQERSHEEGRLAGIEEAAKVADGFTCGGCGMDGKCAAAIRALGALPNDP